MLISNKASSVNIEKTFIWSVSKTSFVISYTSTQQVHVSRGLDNGGSLALHLKSPMPGHHCSLVSGFSRTDDMDYSYLKYIGNSLARRIRFAGYSDKSPSLYDSILVEILVR